ncbi:tetratricopeptide repeat protein [uncultured Sphingomonas sp.]|uniref:SPOR domain-containing protein n=1 Tax=uncultured Sphingomonas sp. TaxID=158754 RepID=UPI00263A2A78|nr:tetratricopeptide repeat protein [uncultured Sphingomonas sp.]
MRIRAVASLSLTALVFGGAMVGCTQGGAGVASASSRSDAGVAKQAAANAEKARKALTKGQAAQAAVFAEAAVAMQPRDAGYRALLAGAYLKAGRFASAETAYGDVLALTPTDGRAALNLALAQTAGGDWESARKTLAAHTAQLDPTDLGLALALAGSPTEGVEVLIAATRAPGATVKTRQNLALAMALAGRWQEAHNMAAVDLSPAEADQRIMQWAAFAKPNHVADQVAALLGVTPAQDPGQPVALALNASVPVAVANADNDAGTAVMSAPEPKKVAIAAVVAPMPQAVAVEQARPVIEPAPAPVLAQMPSATPAKVVFAPRREFVQAIPARDFAAAKLVMAQHEVSLRRQAPIRSARVQEKGDWYVQIGAFSSSGVAKDAWARAQRRFVGFSGKAPAGMIFKVADREYYRLSIGGFSRADADATCRAYRADGGTCFVRARAGDQIAQWAKGGVQVASR